MRRRTHKMGVGPGRIVIYIAVIAIMWLAGHIYNKYIEPNKEFIEQISGGLSDAMTQEASLVSGFSAVANPSQNESSPNIESQNESAELPRIKNNSFRKGWAELPATPKQKQLFTTHHFYKQGRRNYSVCYSSKYHCPVWVAAPLHRSYKGDVKRNDSYTFDPTISVDIQPLLTRSYGQYTRGHMLGSAERTASRAMNEQTFYSTNIAPQLRDGFNTRGGAWNNIERVVDKQICNDTLYVVTGCLFDNYTHSDGRKVKASNTTNKGDKKQIAVPTAFYKAMLRTKRGSTGKSVMECKADELKCAAIIVPHTSAAGYKPSSRDLISIKELERLSGVEFFANVKNAPKGKANPSDWGL